MKAFVITGPRSGHVMDVPEPVATPGQVVVEVERAGVCGTDSEFFSGAMAYLDTGEAAYPIRIGHEWCGRVVSVGSDADAQWLGRRVTGDTMLGCRSCDRCLSGRQHLCESRYEIGIRGGWPGALAQLLPVPVTALVPLPDAVDAVAGAMVEPGANALRSVWGAGVTPGSRVLVIGAGTIGLLVAQIARAKGGHVDVVGRSARSLDFAASLGIGTVSADAAAGGALTAGTPPYDCVIDASNDSASPSLALQLVEPGGRVVYVGLSGQRSVIDSRVIALKDLTVVGVLSGSGGLNGTAELYASGAVDPRPLVAATVGLDAVSAILAGERPPGATHGPKLHIDPRL